MDSQNAPMKTEDILTGKTKKMSEIEFRKTEISKYRKNIRKDDSKIIFLNVRNVKLS